MPPSKASKCVLYRGGRERWENLKEVIFSKRGLIFDVKPVLNIQVC